MLRQFFLSLTLTIMPYTITANAVTSPTNEQQQISLDTLIAINFLKARKASIADHFWVKDYTLAEKIFGKDGKASVTLHELKMNITRETSFFNDLIVIETSLGSPSEDFETLNVLENEKQLLKYILLAEYLKNYKEMLKTQTSPITVVKLSPRTKSICAPQHLTYTKKTNPYSSHEEVDPTRKGIMFTTTFTASEFDALIQEYFLEKTAEKTTPAKKGWW